MKPKRKIFFFYGVVVVFIIVAAAFLFFWGTKKTGDDQVNINTTKTDKSSTENVRVEISDNKVIFPKYVKIANTDFPIIM